LPLNNANDSKEIESRNSLTCEIQRHKKYEACGQKFGNVQVSFVANNMLAKDILQILQPDDR
jgi:hypothetical protein